MPVVQNRRSKAVETPLPPDPPDFEFEAEELEETPEVLDLGGFQPIKATKTPEFPTKVIKAKDSHIFWNWLGNLSDEDWTKVSVYLYRQWPIINKRLTDPSANTNIGKFMDRFTEDHIKEQHGSGEYKLIVNDSSRTVGGKGGKIGEAYISINDPSYPPMVELGEIVVSHPQNREFVAQLKREGKLDNAGNVMTPTQQGSGDNGVIKELLEFTKELTRNQLRQQVTPPAKDTTAEAVTTMMMKTHERSLELVKDQIKGDDPEKLVKLMTALATMMNGNKNDNGMLEMMMKMQIEQAKLQAEASAGREALLLKLMEVTNKPKEDNFDKELDRFIKMKELMGGGDDSGGKRKWWEVAIENGAPVLAEVIKGVTQFIAVKSVVDNRPPASPQSNPQVITQPQQIEEPMQQQSTVEQKQPSPLIQYGGMVINALQRGTNGGDFAHSIETMFGPLVYDQIAAAGQEQILAEMKSVPEFWNQVASHEATLVQFIEDFIAYGQAEEEEEETK